MNFEEKLIERLKRVEREVERLRVWERPAGGGGATDHGALTGLSDDDHPQYLLQISGDIFISTILEILTPIPFARIPARDILSVNKYP